MKGMSPPPRQKKLKLVETEIKVDVFSEFLKIK